jgi:hypothetical protein
VNTGGDTPAERAFIALANAQIDLAAGFTTVADMDSRGGFNTVARATPSMPASFKDRACRSSVNRSTSGPINYYPDK